MVPYGNREKGEPRQEGGVANEHAVVVRSIRAHTISITLGTSTSAAGQQATRKKRSIQIITGANDCINRREHKSHDSNLSYLAHGNQTPQNHATHTNTGRAIDHCSSHESNFCFFTSSPVPRQVWCRERRPPWTQRSRSARHLRHPRQRSSNGAATPSCCGKTCGSPQAFRIVEKPAPPTGWLHRRRFQTQ